MISLIKLILLYIFSIKEKDKYEEIIDDYPVISHGHNFEVLKDDNESLTVIRDHFDNQHDHCCI